MIVRYDPPPIPDRRFDWVAYEDEECGPYGYGRTRDEAVADYQQQVEDEPEPVFTLVAEDAEDLRCSDEDACPAEPLYDKWGGL